MTDEQYDDLDELPAPPRKDILEADRLLLELVARALGATFEEVDGEGYGNLHFADGLIAHAWNPLQFSGDALELAVKLDMNIEISGGYSYACTLGNCSERHGDDPTAATRRAIVRAAAEIAPKP